MPHSDASRSASQKFDWETRFYRCLSLPHVELADRASQAEWIIFERTRESDTTAISAAEREALDDAVHHLRLIRVQHLGYAPTDGELLEKRSSLPERSEIDRPSCDLTGRPIPLSERRHLWKNHAA
jgi:hypothetical protein